MMEGKDIHHYIEKDRAVYERPGPITDGIMNSMPVWIIRWGTVVLCLLFSGLFAIAAFIHFPEIISVAVTVKQVKPVYMAEAKVPAELVRKVHAGQQAVISLNAWPGEEFGTLRGIVTDVSPLVNDSFATFHIELAKGLETNFHKVLKPLFTGNGTARLVVSDRTLLGMVYDKLIR
jgi:hypothetical protein